MERRLAAILYADVAGYSRLVDLDEEGTHWALKARLKVFVDSIAENGGRVCHFAGDAVLAEFQSVTAALKTAVAIQVAFNADDRTTPTDNRVRFRIGINLGEVIADGEEIFGTGVNVAVRIQELAEPGGITISSRAKEQVDGASDVGFVALGRKRVKNIQSPVRVFRIVMDRSSGFSFDFRRSMRRLSRPAALVLSISILLLATAAVTLWMSDRQAFLSLFPGSPVTFPSTQTRIAVLPFRNARGESREDYFADAITEDLTSALGRFGEIGVVASEAIAAYADAPAWPRDLRDELGVSYLLTGSVRRDTETLRLTTKLIDTKSGLQVWSERYDRPLGELFEVQDEIVRTIAAKASITLGQLESERAFGKAMPDLEAYDLYLRGRALLTRETRTANVEARALFRKAIEKDPRFARAHVGLGMTHYREATRGWSQFMARNVAEAGRLARRALQLDSNSADAYVLSGMVSLISGQFEEAERALQLAMQLNPNNVEVLIELGTVEAYIGNVDGSVEMLERAVSLGANLNSRTLAILAMGYVLQNDPEKAVVLLKSQESGRRDHFYFATLAAAHVELGNVAQARGAAERTRRAWPFFSAAVFAEQYQDPQHRQRIINDLRRAGLS